MCAVKSVTARRDREREKSGVKNDIGSEPAVEDKEQGRKEDE